jgi:hypothetical protein
MDVKRSIMELKQSQNGVKAMSKRICRMYTGFSRTGSGFSRSLQVARSAVDGRRPGKVRSSVRFWFR